MAMLSRPGGPDPMTWVETIHPDTRARVCSVRRFPPTRRVSRLASAADPTREIAASAAIPFGAQPVEIDDALHVDGAVWSVTNADLVEPGEVEVAIVIAPLVTTDGGTLVSSLGRHQLMAELAPLARAGVPTLVFAPSSAQYRHRQDRPRHRADGERLARDRTG
jgi:predicted acylesterase/phospholipase RssA